MRVGIFGWYKYGNFGDDVMAIILARHLRSLGHEPVVYQLPSFHADPEGVATASTIEDLLEASDVCILGGGGHLCEIPGEDKLDEELSELTKLAAVKDVQLHADLVFLSPNFWPAPGPDGHGRKGVYVQGVGTRSRRGRKIHLYSLLRTGRLARVVSSTYGNENKPIKAYAPAKVPYTDIASYAALFSSAQAFFSPKLHLGVFGMAYGCPFYCLGGLPKTRVQLEELGLSANYIPEEGSLSVARIVRAEREQTETVGLLAERARTSASGHLTALERFLASFN